MKVTKFIDNSNEIKRQIDEQIKKALQDVGKFVEGEAKLRSPVDTGDLRKSIGNRVVSDDTVVIGTDIEYAVYVEKGTSRQVAQPYLTPSAEENIKEIGKIIATHLSKVGGR